MIDRFRSSLRPEDARNIEALVRATGFFSEEEIRIARELADDGLLLGQSSHYQFLLVDEKDGLAGYACFGHVPCTLHAWDLYWIAVHPEAQGGGLGRALARQAEARIRAAGGSRVYADTSSRDQYAPTRAFYERCGYQVAAQFPDFYAPGDGKIVYLKVLGPRSVRS